MCWILGPELIIPLTKCEGAFYQINAELLCNTSALKIFKISTFPLSNLCLKKIKPSLIANQQHSLLLPNIVYSIFGHRSDTMPSLWQSTYTAAVEEIMHSATASCGYICCTAVKLYPYQISEKGDGWLY